MLILSGKELQGCFTLWVTTGYWDTDTCVFLPDIGISWIVLVVSSYFLLLDDLVSDSIVVTGVVLVWVVALLNFGFLGCEISLGRVIIIVGKAGGGLTVSAAAPPVLRLVGSTLVLQLLKKMSKADDIWYSIYASSGLKVVKYLLDSASLLISSSCFMPMSFCILMRVSMIALLTCNALGFSSLVYFSTISAIWSSLTLANVYAFLFFFTMATTLDDSDSACVLEWFIDSAWCYTTLLASSYLLAAFGYLLSFTAAPFGITTTSVIILSK